MNKYSKNSKIFAVIITLFFGFCIAILMHHKVEVYPDYYKSQVEEFNSQQRTVLCMAISPDCGWFSYESKKGFPFKSGSGVQNVESADSYDTTSIIGFFGNVIFFALILYIPILVIYDFFKKRLNFNQLRLIVLVLILSSLIIYGIKVLII